jgi:hypothetical protein
MYGCRRLKVLVNPIRDTNPEPNKKTCEGNDSKGKATRFGSYSPESRRECMNGEYLQVVGCASVHRRVIPNTYESDQCNSEFTDLLNDTLRCAIWACRNDPDMGPSDIEDSTDGL